ncbi:conserved hypothetical protein [Solidesulfovibrio fructosivorans JJ]]|uniref:Uncharacterized protein n=1 Tax=Solidesulfovibrio fructosivorans JJ] TaxID=596151 RepID=E1JVA4_SOLFR|nr:hypothetical protein [Solidesulfovibrio fructosivorans]EFL51698.1 conserved hypothetical protein [Solidesulfovibrio fructosivorans JJ]]
MAAGGKIDILLLRDGAGVRRYRTSVWLLRCLWLVPLGLLLLLAAAVAVAYHLRQDNLLLARHQGETRKELDAVGEKLIRLENIEKVLRTRDLTELETLIGSYNPDDPGWWKPRTEAGGDAPKSGGKEREPAKAERPDLAKLLAHVDAGEVGIDNLRVKIEGKKLALNFDLSNVTPQQTNLSGRVEVAFVGNDASLLPLTADKDELSFQIQHFKQMSASLPLPQKVSPRDVYALKLTVLDPAGKIIFAQTYPMKE